MEYNQKHGITPQTVQRNIGEGLVVRQGAEELNRHVVRESGVDYDVHEAIQELEKEMLEAAQALEFERAAVLRDEMNELRRMVDGESGK